MCVVLLGIAATSPVPNHEMVSILSTSETGETNQQLDVVAPEPQTIVSSRSNVALVLQDMGIDDADEKFNCDWYGGDIPRAAVALEVCELYLKQRVVNCVEWTRAYNKKHPKVVRHITLEEVHSKCGHVVSKLDQVVNVPGDTGTCVWCMTHVNTN